MYKLRFDVETIYKATQHSTLIKIQVLRFDVETIYKATNTTNTTFRRSCGLM